MSDILNRLFVSVKKIITANLPFVILIAILFGYFTVRALPENRWNGWKCCSTQMLLTAGFWARDGLFNHYLLGLNQGYGKIVRYFDEPELQQHAHGAVASNLLAQKLYFTASPVFMSNADIIEYLPLEDALVFSIMFLSIVFLNRLNLKNFNYYKTYLAAIWGASFLLKKLFLFHCLLF